MAAPVPVLVVVKKVEIVTPTKEEEILKKEEVKSVEKDLKLEIAPPSVVKDDDSGEKSSDQEDSDDDSDGSSDDDEDDSSDDDNSSGLPNLKLELSKQKTVDPSMMESGMKLDRDPLALK